MSTTTVSIGRNVGAVPMTDREWEAFRAAVSACIARAGNLSILFTGTGVGTWTDADGVEVIEQSATWVVEDVIDIEGLTLDLARTAKRYGQDAIAVTTGETVLAGLQHTTA